jgi:hypothetical protein
MGLQDYTTQLSPSSDVRISFHDLAGSLTDLKFVALDPIHIVGGAFLGEIPQHEVALVRQDNVSIIEALVRLDTEVPDRVSNVSVRFALCQPQAATTTFLAIVGALAREYQFYIKGEQQRYCPDCIDEFRIEVEQQVAAGKARWRELFEGDTSELPIRVDQAWSYFLERHPNLVAAR